MYCMMVSKYNIQYAQLKISLVAGGPVFYLGPLDLSKEYEDTF